jgi:hypothetical protein
LVIWRAHEHQTFQKIKNQSSSIANRQANLPTIFSYTRGTHHLSKHRAETIQMNVREKLARQIPDRQAARLIREGKQILSILAPYPIVMAGNDLSDQFPLGEETGHRYQAALAAHRQTRRLHQIAETDDFFPELFVGFGHAVSPTQGFDEFFHPHSRLF